MKNALKNIALFIVETFYYSLCVQFLCKECRLQYRAISELWPVTQLRCAFLWSDSMLYRCNLVMRLVTESFSDFLLIIHSNFFLKVAGAASK